MFSYPFSNCVVLFSREKSANNSKKGENAAVPNHLRQTLEPKAIKPQSDEKVGLAFSSNCLHSFNVWFKVRNSLV